MKRESRYRLSYQPIALLGILCLVLAMPAAVAQQNLIVNGSFEADAHPGYPGYIGHAPQGWVEYGGSHIINEHVQATSPFHWGSGNVPDGAKVYGCQGAGLIGQYIGGLTTGTACTLSFAYNLRTGNTGMNVEVRMGSQTLWGPTLVTHQSQYLSATVNFTYNEAWTNAFMFIFTNPGGDNTVLLDNVKLMATPTYRTVTPSVVGGNGTITPSTAQQVLHNGSLPVTLTPSPGYRVSELKVNGTPVTSLPLNYLLENITTNTTVSVSFAKADWTFDTDGNFEGWNPGQDIEPGSVVSGGALRYDITNDAGDPMWTSQPLSLPRANFRWLRIIAKNGTGAHLGILYWDDNTVPGFSSGHEVGLRLFRNDGEMTEYWADLNEVPAWTGATTIEQLRLDFPDSSNDALSASGTRMEIDRITLLPANEGPPAPGFKWIRRESPEVAPPTFTNSTGVVWRMRFNHRFLADLSDVTLVTTGTVTAGAPNVYAEIQPMEIVLGYPVSGEGSIKMAGTGSGSGTSVWTNAKITTPFNDGEVFLVDTVGPTVTISAPSAAITNSGPVSFSVTYADGAYGSGLGTVTLTAGDVTLNTTGNADATVAVSGSGANWTITLSNITGDGTLGVSIGAGTAEDKVGNPASASDDSATFVVDNTAPKITLQGNATVNVAQGSPYTDAGATASDDRDGDISSEITRTGSVDTNVLGDHVLRYNVSDSAGNAAEEKIRTVHVYDSSQPNVETVAVTAALTVELVFSKDMSGTTGLLTPATYTVSGSGRGTLNEHPASVTAVNGTTVKLSWSHPNEMFNGGAIRITVDATLKDTYGTPIQNNVGEDSSGAIGTAPVITLNATDETVECSVGTFTESGASAVDDVDGSVAVTVTGDDAVDTGAVDVYTITYTATDAAGNTATATRTVTVEDSTGPVITLVDEDIEVEIECGEDYVDPGATATDLCEGDLDAEGIVVDSSAIDNTTPGTYTVTYNVTDSEGNVADEVTRTVKVVDTTPPIITLEGANPLVLDNGDSFTDPGVTAEDACDGTIATITVDDSEVNDRAIGDYKVYYTAEDSAGNKTTVERDVQVRRDACKLLYKFEVTPNPAVPGESITMQVTAEAGSCAVGDLHFVWEKRSADKADWMAIPTALDAPGFVIDTAEEEDAGDYRCTVTDDMTVFTSPVVTVKVGTSMPVAGLAGLALAGVLTALAGAAALRKGD
jgi:hypothetical protein